MEIPERNQGSQDLVFGRVGPVRGWNIPESGARARPPSPLQWDCRISREFAKK